jgi:hypothetical protein
MGAFCITNFTYYVVSHVATHISSEKEGLYQFYVNYIYMYLDV